MGVMRRGARGFPCRVTPSHFGLYSRGAEDRLSAPGLLFFQATRRRQNNLCVGSCCQACNCEGVSNFFMVLCSRSSRLYDSFASFFLLPFEGLGVILIRPCSEWFKTFSGKVNDELVWELGQTCASCSEWSHNNF